MGTNDEKSQDVYYGDLILTHKFTLKKRDKSIEEYNDVNDLPDGWFSVVNKANNDYSIDNLFTEKPEKYKREIGKIETDTTLLEKYRHVTEEAWIDMGVEADDGGQLFWAIGDLMIRNDYTFGICDLGEYGTLFGWGCLQLAESSEGLETFGGSNPPKSIVGNPNLDVVSAYLNNPARMPSFEEWKRLLDNTEAEFISIQKGLPDIGSNGLPSWVQGQWTAQARVGSSVFARSYKIDGLTSSVIDTEGGRVSPVYSGVYDYYEDEHKLVLGNIVLYVNENTKTLQTDNGVSLKKVSMDTESSKTFGLRLKSKVNGNTLFFPLPQKNVVITKGDHTFEFQSPQVNDYWGGTLYDEDPKMAWHFHIKGSNPVQVALGGDNRNALKSVRPVSSKPVTVTIGE